MFPLFLPIVVEPPGPQVPFDHIPSGVTWSQEKVEAGPSDDKLTNIQRPQHHILTI